MDTSNTTPEVTLADRYNPTAVIVLNPSEYLEKSAQDLNFDLRRLDSYRSIANTQTSNISSVKDYLIENYEELGDHADEIATMLDIELTREITYSVSMSCSVTVTVKCGEDGEDLITDNLYIDSNGGDISVDDYQVDTVYEA
jgi:sugar-specific transcriptional regulator TrmB